MRVIEHKRKEYLPVLTKDRKLDMRAMVAYGPAGSGVFMLSVYLLCKYKGAGSRGGTEIQHFDLPVMRGHISNVETQAAQVQQLEFMCNIVATQHDRDYKLRLPISPKPTPAGRTTVKRHVNFSGDR